MFNKDTIKLKKQWNNNSVSVFKHLEHMFIFISDKIKIAWLSAFNKRGKSSLLMIWMKHPFV